MSRLDYLRKGPDRASKFGNELLIRIGEDALPTYHGRINTTGEPWAIDPTHVKPNLSRVNRYAVSALFATPDPKLATAFALERHTTDGSVGELELYEILPINPDARIINLSIPKEALSNFLRGDRRALTGLEPDSPGSSAHNSWKLFERNPVLAVQHYLVRKNTHEIRGVDGKVTERPLDHEYLRQLIAQAGIIGSFARTSTNHYSNLPNVAYFDLESVKPHRLSN